MWFVCCCTAASLSAGHSLPTFAAAVKSGFTARAVLCSRLHAARTVRIKVSCTTVADQHLLGQTSALHVPCFCLAVLLQHCVFAQCCTEPKPAAELNPHRTVWLHAVVKWGPRPWTMVLLAAVHVFSRCLVCICAAQSWMDAAPTTGSRQVGSCCDAAP